MLLVCLALASVFFAYSIGDDRSADCYGWYSASVEPEAYKAWMERGRSFACRYPTVMGFSMLVVAAVHFILMTLTFVQLCLTTRRMDAVHPDVMLVGQQPRSGRYV